jgi:uncharacterized protein
VRHGPLLAVLALLFLGRVVGQALVAFLSVRWLPAMHEWHSGLIPYPILLAIQLIMLAIMIQISRDIWRGSGFFDRARPSWSRYLVGFSAVYAGAMVLRYILTMIFLPEMRWLGGTIPIFFHFVLATFLFALGRFHARRPTFARVSDPC